MKCVLCGKDSLRPVCKDCTAKIKREYPFLIRKGFLSGNFEEDLNKALERDLLFNDILKNLNDMAKNALQGKGGNYALLTQASLHLHRHYSFYLKNFEIGDDYYLSLAEKFSSKVRGDEGRYLKYEIMRERGNLKGALKILDSISNKDRKYLLEKAKLLVERGEMDAAEGIYQELLKDEDPKVWRTLADALFTRGSYEGALKVYAHIVEIKKDDHMAYYRMALCHQYMGNLKMAMEALSNAIKANKYHVESYLLLLALYERRNMKEERKKLITKMRRIGLEPSFFGVG